MKETAVLINTRDRPTEVTLLLQSLRSQSYKNWDIFILDDCGGTPLFNYHFFNCMIMRLQLEDHRVFIKRSDFNLGVSKARHEIVGWALKEDYKYFVRVDDDVVLNPDYLERLYALKDRFDICSGVTVPMQSPVPKRNPKFLGKIINRVILDKKGNYIWNGDDCGMLYTHDKVLPAHHFRSCALIKRAVHEKVKYYPTVLSKHGFREEQVFSYKAIMEGFKIGVDTGAVNWHQITPSGGERHTTNLSGFNQEQFEKFTRDNVAKLKPFFPDKPMPNKLERMKKCNLI